MKKFVVLGCVFVLAALATAQQVSSSATAGKLKKGAVPVTVTIKVPEGYHIYGPKATETGVPTSVKVKDAVATINSISFPKTKVMTLAGEKMEVYEGKVTITMSLKSKKKGKQKVQLLVKSQACNDRTCLPPTTLTVPVTVNFG